MKVRKGKVFNFFKDNYEITFFYKPTNNDNDTLYYIILDDKVRISLRLYDNILVIYDINQIGFEYLNDFYNNFLFFLVNQTTFTVLVSKLNNLGLFNNVCISKNVPVVEYEKFIMIPKSLYEQLKIYYSNDVNNYGFYLLAVVENTDMDTKVCSVNEEAKVGHTLDVISDIIEKPLMDKVKDFLQSTYKNIKVEDDIYKRGISFILDEKVKIILKEDKDKRCINIISFELVSTVAAHTDFMKVCEVLEKFDNCDIYLVNVSDSFIYSICKYRNYERVDHNTIRSSASNFGSYKLIRSVNK